MYQWICSDSVWDVTLPVSARWLVKHWNRADVPRPPQQPGDPQVKTEPRRGVNWPSPLRQGGRLQPLDSSCQPWSKPSFHVLPRPRGSSVLWPSTLLSPLFSRKEYLIPPQVQTDAAAASTTPPTSSGSDQENGDALCVPCDFFSVFFLFGTSDEINLPGRRSVWRMSSRTASLWSAALQRNSAVESVGSPEGPRGITSNTSSEFHQVSSTHSSPHILRLCHVSGANWVSSACLKARLSHLHWGVQAVAQGRPRNTQSASITSDKRSVPDSLDGPV